MLEPRAVLAERCPQLAVESVVPLGEGDFCTVYAVHALDSEWVFRFAKHDDAAASLRREACLLPGIADCFDLRVPRPEIVEVGSAPAFVAHRMLPGPSLTKDRYLRLADGDRNRCAVQVGAFLAQLHSTDPAIGRRCGLPTLDYAARCAEVHARARQHAFPLLDSETALFVDEQLTSGEPRVAVVDPRLLHGDLSPEHVLYDEAARTVSAVIVFGDVTIGDPAWDFVYIYEDYGLDFLRRAVRAYRPDSARALLVRMFGFYVLDLVDWVAGCAEKKDPELAEAVDELASVRVGLDRRLDELLGTCLG
jgi:aminoglycoside 2''-phosphotransferase